MQQEVKHICLWASPRNISTAIMYSFAQRKDCKVFDEPLYGFYLKNSEAKNYHPGANEIINTMETDGQKIIHEMFKNNQSEVIFYKQMTHHLLHLDLSFLSRTCNVILTRNPKNMVASFSKVIKNPDLSDLGYIEQVKLLEYLQKNNLPVLVVDSFGFVKSPEKSIRLLCEKLEISFFDSMLSWAPGPIPEDGIWAKYWYKNVHQSTGFNLPKSTPAELSAQNEFLVEKCMPLYDKLMTNSIFS